MKILDNLVFDLIGISFEPHSLDPPKYNNVKENAEIVGCIERLRP
jgi:hypothetical protein